MGEKAAEGHSPVLDLKISLELKFALLSEV